METSHMTVVLSLLFLEVGFGLSSKTFGVSLCELDRKCFLYMMSIGTVGGTAHSQFA